MQSPKKGLVCNLNHVHLQHISLGLHLSRHPELQEEANTLTPPRKGTECHDCREYSSSSALELVDANSNNPSLTCQCCDGHPLHSEVKQDLQTLQTLPNCPVLNHEEEEEEEEGEEIGSPLDPTSSSVSSCSDLSLDDTPVSVYCKEFPVEEAQSPENQPNIVPLEDDAHNGLPLSSPGGRILNLNIQKDEHPISHVWDSPDSLGSSSSLESPSDMVSPHSQTPAESLVTGSNSPSLLVPPPVRPCRAPPAVPVRCIGPELDSNCNALPPREPKPESLSPGQVDINSNQAGPPRPRFVGAPPPVPPRTKRGLQGLRRCEPGKPSSMAVPSEASSELPVRQGDPHSEGTKNITSFHELAQKRKKVAAMPLPAQTRKDQSDWLIVFSPDTELPPCHELTWGGVPNQETVGPQAAPPEPANTASCLQRGVTTFKELRYRKQKGHLPPQVGTQMLQQVEPSKAMLEGSAPPQESDPEPPLKGHFRSPKEIPARRKKSRPGLQPIMEGGFEEGEDGGAENKVSDRRMEGPPNGRRDPWMPGKEERRDRSFMEVQHSQTFGGIPNTSHLWRADTDRPSAQLREQKKALLVAVSASVDKIVAHFSTARNLVQKAQLGDSRLNPDVGYLVLSTLCPALRALVGDGLKPFQKDVITGQRPSSPWSVVEASAKPGPHTRSLNALYWRVSRLAPLRSNQQRFHAFILGLLNMKQLEQWFAHLQQNSELISALYLPTAFLVLSQGFCRCWAEELLLLLQPLSMLTFQLDLLFEHHHLPLNVRPMPQHAITPTETPTGSTKASGLRRPDLPRHPTPPSELAEGPLAQSSPIHESQVGAPLHQRLLQWGDWLTHTLLGNEASPKPELCPQTIQQEMELKQSWWEQLNWPSGIYTNSTASSISKQEGFPHTQWTKLWMVVGEALKEARISMAEAASSPSLGEGGSKPQASATEVGNLSQDEAAKKPEMTIPSTRESCLADAQVASENLGAMDTPGSGKGRWLGWLFGANYPGAPNEPGLSLPKTSRRPSSWLPPTMNVLASVMKTVPAEKSWQKESWEDVSPDPLQTYRAVRALCDHVGSGDNQLSFCKGDILQVLDTVDEDWLQCCHGDRRGLVPVSYTSLIL